MMLKLQKSSKEENLIKGCCKGEARAQKQLFERYAPRMLTVCRRYITDNDQAEDVMLVAWVKVFERIGQFRGQGSFEGWLRRVMVNESLTWLRQNKQMYLHTDLDEADRSPDLGVLENHLEAEDIMKMVQQLPAGYRTVFNLYAIEGYSHKEIAKTLDITENTSKSQLSRARLHLQKLLLASESVLAEEAIGHGANR